MRLCASKIFMYGTRGIAQASLEPADLPLLELSPDPASESCNGGKRSFVKMS